MAGRGVAWRGVACPNQLPHRWLSETNPNEMILCLFSFSRDIHPVGSLWHARAKDQSGSLSLDKVLLEDDKVLR